MAQGPLAVRWLDWEIGDVQAGAVADVHVRIENSGTVAWRRGIRLGYHWLDERGNALVWDGERTEIPHLAPGEKGELVASVRAPIPPGRYQLALDLVAERRAWFSELGGDQAVSPVDVAPRSGKAVADLPPNVTRSERWQSTVDAAHAEGYAVVAGAIDWQGGRLHPRPRALEPYAPGSGRIPGFTHPLICPSVLDGIELERLDDIAGLPAFAAPNGEPWIYDGRAVLVAKPG